MSYPTLSQGARLTAVKLKDTAGNEIGKVVEWIMDVVQGKVVYVVADLKEADNYYAIPWALMKADLQNGGYIVDRKTVETSNVSIDRTAINNLVNDKDFLDRMLTSYNVSGEQTSGQQGERSPSAGQTEQRERSEQTYPSNAEVSEGKGYGG
ncbi:PRC-barrel domain-containing protein [Chryseosolibacter indicus]|uniref:PRC-barrel domain-containing protein n=1 Tax=Chryseosolibacter indicus TaxID=2782351 RepID=A0ABS5VLA1_9BACT|nr:PRC-barrel domain-containing protein [Chryseosolibacter indicus]MBT1702219.1 PRC-barrel domain-containing protein [Chryseosolibacter indicus]